MDKILTEDGREVSEGDTVFDYYNGYWGIITDIDSQGWFYHVREEGGKCLLNGQRVCVRIPPGNPFYRSHAR